MPDPSYEVRIAETFTQSLGRLTGEEQKATKTTAFDLQINPNNPGMQFHRIEKSKDKNFWSIRINRDLRIILHKSNNSLMLCYVDHHDRAYSWAERRKIEVHPRTGAAQLVEIRETFQEVFVPYYIDVPADKKNLPAKALFADVSDDELLSYGVPEEWLADVHAATEDSLLVLAEHLPSEAAEALLELATGGKPKKPEPLTQESSNPFDHPDALRRFRVVANLEELKKALDYPWEKWIVFLHPDQQQLVERKYNGPARVSGSAGTGKTIVALHRAVFLARQNADSRVLLTTYTSTLANALHDKLRRLVSSEPLLGERIDVQSLDAIAIRLYRSNISPVELADDSEIRKAIGEELSKTVGLKLNHRFVVAEWEQIVDAWQVNSWEAYRDIPRLGRKTRIAEPQRRLLWNVFEAVQGRLKHKGVKTRSSLFSELAEYFAKSAVCPFDFIVADESQDLTISQLRFFAALGRKRPDALFFAGDLGQRIFQTPFSWKSLGIDIRGRSKTLRINYRTSHQIRMQLDRLLGSVVSDVDGNEEDRSDTVSVFNGPPPVIQVLDSEDEEIRYVSKRLSELTKSSILPHEIGIFVRTQHQIPRAKRAAESAGMTFEVLDERVATTNAHVSICTMHLAKGLEFRAVIVMACDDEVIPLQERMELVGDDADLQEVYDTERQLLYVGCTRARDHLLITAVSPASEFLDDLTEV